MSRRSPINHHRYANVQVEISLPLWQALRPCLVAGVRRFSELAGSRAMSGDEEAANYWRDQARAVQEMYRAGYDAWHSMAMISEISPADLLAMGEEAEKRARVFSDQEVAVLYQTEVA